MKNSECIYSDKCKLFNNNLLDNNSEEIYKTLYCKTNKWTYCKRYQIYHEIKECPDYIMPNSRYKVSTILEQYPEEKRMFNHHNINIS